jgi:hypothetical protein
MRAPLILVLLSLLALCACTEPSRPMAEPAPLPAAIFPYPTDGPLMIAALRTLADFRSRLQEHYEQPLDVHRYAVPADIRWDTVTEHYTRALGADWHTDTRYVDKSGQEYRSMVWTDGKHVVAIALNESPQADAAHALTVFFSDDAR